MMYFDSVVAPVCSSIPKIKHCYSTFFWLGPCCFIKKKVLETLCVPAHCCSCAAWFWSPAQQIDYSYSSPLFPSHWQLTLPIFSSQCPGIQGGLWHILLLSIQCCKKQSSYHYTFHTHEVFLVHLLVIKSFPTILIHFLFTEGTKCIYHTASFCTLHCTFPILYCTFPILHWLILYSVLYITYSTLPHSALCKSSHPI